MADSQHEPVAIVGMGCRWPGGAHSTSQFWEFLRDRVDGWKEFNSPRFSTAGFHHPNADRPGSFSMKGAFLASEDARLFDHAFFGMTRLEVETMDPSQRKLLEVAYEAIENAGETWESVSGSRTGVFVGNFCLDHWMIQSRDWDNPRPYAFTGAGTSILANRISYIFNFHGPSLTVDTACSSSMYALHLAVNAIRAGDCDAAIVGAANWIADPGVQIALDKLGALSASSRCHTFDARAEGYARGEGYGAIYLKKADLAVADQSPIRAMIRGTAINSNGRTGGITRPSAQGQETVIRDAYRNAGDLPFHETSYFECHGTGTYVGDPIEVAAVGRVFAGERTAEDPLLVGSVKSNIGHGEGSSALASVMKVVLALEKGEIPPVFSLETRNPNIDFLDGRIEPVTKVRPWPADRLRRASINSFGYGGANGHCIIDHVNNVLPDYVAPGVYKAAANGDANGGLNGKTNCHADGHVNGLTKGHINGHTNGDTNGHQNGTSSHHRPIVKKLRGTAKRNATTRQYVLLPLSAHKEDSLRSNLDVLGPILPQLSLADVAYTLGTRRSKLAQRAFCIVDQDNVASSLELEGRITRAPLQPANVAFIFTGQGAQWPGMGAELLHYRVFQTAMRHLDEVLRTLRHPPSWSLADLLTGAGEAASIHMAGISQPICTAVQIGLVDLLASWSIWPAAVAGHSSGEIAAAYASGHITAAEAIVAAYLRGQAVSGNQKKGAMLAVGLGIDDVAPYLDTRDLEVQIAAINSPGSVTLAGDETAIDALSDELTTAGLFNRKLSTGGNAYHSYHMRPIGREYMESLVDGMAHLQQLGLVSDPEGRYQPVPWISSVTPGKAPGQVGDNLSSYWRANLESPVRFSEAITRLVSMDDLSIDGLVEIGPHAALKSPLEQIVKAAGKKVTYASTLRRQEDSRRSVLQLAGTLFTWNAAVDLAAVNAVDAVAGAGLEHGCTCLELPPYQYTYAGLNYHESRASKEYRLRAILRHDLLGSQVVGTTKLRPQWCNILRIKDVPWLADHRLAPDAVLPGAAYLAMAVEAATRIHHTFPESPRITGVSLRDVAIKKALVIPEDDYGVEVTTSLELVDVATAASPAWVTFSISSIGRESNEWTEHSTGQVKVELQAPETSLDAEDTIPPVVRSVDTRAWYQQFRAIGLDYGPAFQPLSQIGVDPASRRAVATIDLHPTSMAGGESRYALHPASLDGAIQLGLIACHGGRPSEAHTAFVPVHFSHLYLAYHETAAPSAMAIARGSRQGVRSAHLNVRMRSPNGELWLQMEGLRCLSYSSETKVMDRAFSSPFTRLVWKPDLRLLSNAQARGMYPPPKANVGKSPLWGITDKVAHFIVVSIYEAFATRPDRPQPSGDVGHFFDWIVRKTETDASQLMEEARGLARQGRLRSTIDDLVEQATDVIEVRIAKLLHDNMADILHERRTGIDVILGEELLTPLYQSGLLMTGIYPQLHHVLEGLAHANPNLRILEIGGGTGGATRVAMDAFGQGPNGIKAYRDYTFTDYSPGFLSAARDAMADLHDVEFSVYDMETDPQEQGYELATYDLIIACQVLHATSNMHRTLTHCQQLLRPGGRLVLVETNRHFTVPGVVVGTFTGYWAGIPDGRVDAPFQSVEGWDASLRQAGFSGLDLVLDDFPAPNNTTSVMVSTAMLPSPGESHPQPTVQMLHTDNMNPSLVKRISEEFAQRQIVVQASRFPEDAMTVTTGSRVLALLDDEHLLLDLAEGDLQAFQHVARQAASLITITSCGTVSGRSPDGALIPGLLRVLQNENPASQYLSVDIDADHFGLGDAEATEFARSIADLHLRLDREPVVEEVEGEPLDREYSWQEGCLWVSRHVPDAGFHAHYGLRSDGRKMEQRALATSRGPVRAAFEAPGVLNSLYFTPYTELLQPLAPGWIDVAVAAVGVNWADLHTWTGSIDRNHLSSEYSGTVTAVGPQVTGVKVGDHVYGLGPGQLGSSARVPAAFARPVRPGDDLVQMATIPMAYATAVYIFDHVARLVGGEAVLVHCGAKDVAQACIRLAKAKGANVFALVDTDEQANVLVRDLVLLPRSHVLSSCRMRDLQQAAALTAKGAFDVITGTARGERLSALMQVLAPQGHLIDVAQVEVHTPSTMPLEILRTNAMYCSVDTASILESDPGLGADLLHAVDRYYRTGTIGPLAKIEVVDVGESAAALATFSTLSGKLVVSFENPQSLVRMAPSPPQVTFKADALYVITGALGGLGQSLIRWMVDHGAMHLALLSRRQLTQVPGADRLVESLRERRIDVQCMSCDVSSRDEVMQVIDQLSSARPIRGIVHAAGSYLDLTFDKVSLARWKDSIAAKVAGTRHLHEATLAMPLDLFVMTTSALSVYAFATQGAYTAANNFQDAFARFRRRQGLPASTVSFSLIHEVTDVGTDPMTIDLFERNKALAVGESEFLALVEPVFLNNQTVDPGVDALAATQWAGQPGDPLSAANLHTYLDPAGMLARKRQEIDRASTGVAQPRWYSDRRVSIMMRAFLDAQQHATDLQGSSLDPGAKETTANLRSTFDTAIARGGEARGETVAFVVGAITRAVAEMLFVDVESIDPAKSLADLGVDSLIAAELRNWFLQALGVNISMLDLLEPTLSISGRANGITDAALSSSA